MKRFSCKKSFHFRLFANKILLIANLFILIANPTSKNITLLYSEIINTMKRSLGKTSVATADRFTVEEKIVIIYLGLYIAKDKLHLNIDKAHYQKKISASSRKSWKNYFEDEFNSCVNIKIETYSDCAYLEFKVRHFINALERLCFEYKEPWQGYTIPLNNTFFPLQFQVAE